MNTECLICRIHEGAVSVPGEVIYADNLIYVRHVEIAEGQPDTYLGHLIVETQRHVPDLAGLTDEEAQAIGLWISRFSKALKECEGAEHVYAMVIGDLVKHVHVHLIPRYPGTPREYWGLGIREWLEAPRGRAEEITAVCDRLRGFIQALKPEAPNS